MELTKHASSNPTSRGSPGTVSVKLFHSWRNGVIISYELNCSVKHVSSLHVAWTLPCGPVQVDQRGWAEHAEPRISQVWQSHGVFVIIKPKTHACVDGDCAGWVFTGRALCLGAVMHLHTDSVPRSIAARSPEPRMVWGLNLRLC